MDMFFFGPEAHSTSHCDQAGLCSPWTFSPRQPRLSWVPPTVPSEQFHAANKHTCLSIKIVEVRKIRAQCNSSDDLN